MRKTLVTLLFFFLVGCSGYRLVDVGKVNFENFTIETPIQWNSKSDMGSNITQWTINGSEIDGLLFFEEIGDRQTIFQTKEKDKKSRVYLKDMTEVEVADLISESIKYGFPFADFRYQNLAPRKFGSKKGFYFSLEAKTASGIKYQGLVVGSQENGVLNFIFYYGTQIHHFEQYLPQVKRIIQSIPEPQ